MPTISFDVPAIKTSAFETIAGGEKWGTLVAIDLKAKGKILWQQKTEDPLIGGVLAIAGGLVSTGEGVRQDGRTAVGLQMRRGGGYQTGGLAAYRVQSVALLCRLSWRAKNAGLDEI
jgi:putative pyrroloquinoline-quinone-binding quinoprotein